MSDLVCSECKGEAVHMTKYNSWIELINFIEHLYLNEDISYQLRSHLFNLLMDFREFAFDQEEKEIEDLRKQVKKLKREVKFLNKLAGIDLDKEK